MKTGQSSLGCDYGSIEPTYGGIVLDVTRFPDNIQFHVANGAWWGVLYAENDERFLYTGVDNLGAYVNRIPVYDNEPYDAAIDRIKIKEKNNWKVYTEQDILNYIQRGKETMERSKWCDVCKRDKCLHEGGVHDMEHLKPACYKETAQPTKESVGTRPTKDEYYLKIAEAVLERSTCLRRKYGAVLVKNDEIVSTGYNGSPRGEANCCDVGYCEREAQGVPKGERYELCCAIHAEDNAITSAGRHKACGATLYIVGKNTTDGSYANPAPCKMCRRKIVNAGITRVVGLVDEKPQDIDFKTEK